MEQLLKFEKTISAKAVVLEHKLDSTKDELKENIDRNHAEITVRMKKYNKEIIGRLDGLESFSTPQVDYPEEAAIIN